MCRSPQFSSPLPYHQYNRYYKCQHEYQWPSFHPASRVCESSMGRKLQDKYKYKSSAPLSALPLQFRRERESWGSRDSHVTGGSQPALQLQAAFVPGRPTPYPYTGCQAVSPHPLHMFRLYTSTTTPSVLEAVLRCTVPCEGIPHTSHFKFPPLILSENKARAKRIWIWR